MCSSFCTHVFSLQYTLLVLAFAILGYQVSTLLAVSFLSDKVWNLSPSCMAPYSGVSFTHSPLSLARSLSVADYI